MINITTTQADILQLALKILLLMLGYRLAQAIAQFGRCAGHNLKFEFSRADQSSEDGIQVFGLGGLAVHEVLVGSSFSFYSAAAAAAAKESLHCIPVWAIQEFIDNEFAIVATTRFLLEETQDPSEPPPRSTDLPTNQFTRYRILF